jgi:cell wall-associated NlpC family hydrolase
LATIKKALAALAEKLGVNRAKLAFARKRFWVNHKRAEGNHNKALRAERAADRARANGHKKHARKKDREAARSHSRANKYQGRAQYWIARIKEFKRKVDHLEQSQAEREAQLAKWIKEHGVRIDGDRITGGTPRERLVAGALAAAAGCSSGRRRNVYSQPGAYTVKHGITGEPPGYRTDCSQFVTSMYWSAGLGDPNGYNWEGGYTGTLVANGRQVSDPKPGDLVLYGSGTAHHVEMYVGPGDKTIGHGSAPVDAGVINLFGDGDYRFYSYL